MRNRASTMIALGAIAVAATVTATVTDARADELPEQLQRQVVGWIDGEGGAELVVRRTARGERMVDGESRDFFFELDELREVGGAVKRVFRHGQPDGVQHPDWQEAEPVREGNKSIRGAELAEAKRRWSSPDGRWMLTTYGGSRKVEVEHPRRGLQHVCVSKERLVLLDGDSRRVRVVGNWVERGEQASKKSEAYCPETTWRAWWHPESSHWATVRRVTLSGALVDAPKVMAGKAAIDQAGEAKGGGTVADVLAAGRPLADEAARWEKGPAREGVTALYEGRWTKAKNALEWAISRKDGDAARDAKLRLPLAMAMVRLGQSDEAAEQVELALKQADNFWAHAQAAAVLHLNGATETAEKHLASARRKASGYVEMVRLGELFRYVDLEESNALLVEALKGEDARSVDRTYGDAFRLLVEGLIDAGLHEQADILFGKLDRVPPRMEALRFRAELDRAADGQLPAQAHRRAARHLFAEPGLCQAYLNFGRVLAADGALQAAMRQFRTAEVCDSDDADVHFYLGTTGLRLGELDAARRHIATYLNLAVPRDGDRVRARRRGLAERIDRRLGHRGAVLSSVRCAPGSMGGLECRGVVENTADEPLEGVTVRAVVRAPHKSKKTAEQAADEAADKDTEEPRLSVKARKTLGTVDAGGARTFSLKIDAASAAGLALEAGRSDEELELNRTPIEQR